MESEKLSINVPEGYTGEPITLIIREGGAPKQLDEVLQSKVKREGVITSAEEFVLKHYADALASGTLQAGIVEYSMNPKSLFIKFDEFPAHPILGAIIHGTAVINPEIIEWKVNTKQTFDCDQVIAILRRQAHNLSGTAEVKNLIKLLQNFEAVFTTERRKADDRKGNVEDYLKEAISIKKGELPEALNLTIPIFAGGVPMPLSLEIELDRDGSEVVYSFYSLDFETAIRNASKAAITESVDKLRPAFVCIEKA